MTLFTLRDAWAFNIVVFLGTPKGLAFDHAEKGCRRSGIQCIAVPPSTFQA